MLRYFTSGESHGEALVGFLSGLPAGLRVEQAYLDRELWRRQQGYGRGGRMKIERDTAHVLSGVRHGLTIGSPIAILLENKDWKNWQEALPVETGDPAKHKRVASPRPGHADLAGALKYNFREAGYVLERAAAVMSLQAVKAVEIGTGITAAASPGSAVHDEIGYGSESGFTGFTRTRNNAGGIEGGVSNGQDIRLRGYLKPISTLRRPLQSVDFATRETVKAAYERSDVCVVPAAGVAGEAMVALTLARCALEKFGGDSMQETLRNFQGYCQQLKNY